MNDAPDFDAYAPPEIARRVETVGVAKARMALSPLLALAVVAGAFVALGFVHSVANMCGVLVAPVYWLVYIRPSAPKAYVRRKKAVARR